MEPLFVKICGLRTERDVAAAVEAGADAVGFVFAESPRRIEAELVRELVRAVPEHVLTVGVFRRQPLQEIQALTAASGVRAVQLHGDEGREYYAALRQPGRTLVRAVAARDSQWSHGNGLGEDLLLLDAPAPGAGVTWDWSAPDFAAPEGRWLLAGGLTVENVPAAVAATGAWGVDVSSGVERERGVKDAELIASFVRAARGEA